MSTARAPFPWYGGKQKLLPTLLSLLPEHDNYVEVFGGAAALLFAKPRSQFEVYNDRDSGLVNFFRVLRDAKRAKELQRLLRLTPYSREEYAECKVGWRDAADEVEMARRWFVVAAQSFGGRFGSGWGFESKYNAAKTAHPRPYIYANRLEELDTFIERFAGVYVEHDDFEAILDRYDGPDMLFYCDPPYLPETRKQQGGYGHEMSTGDHARLLRRLANVRGRVILSGYDSPLYSEHLADWARHERPATCHAAGRTKRSTLKGQGAVIEQQARVECIWLNPRAADTQPVLWTFAGERSA